MKFEELLKCNTDVILRVFSYDNEKEADEFLDVSNLSKEQVFVLNLFKEEVFKPLADREVDSINCYKNGLEIGLQYDDTIVRAFWPIKEKLRKLAGVK